MKERVFAARLPLCLLLTLLPARVAAVEDGSSAKNLLAVSEEALEMDGTVIKRIS